MKGKWRSIPGYEGKYEVGSLGRVRSLLGKKIRVLRPSTNKSGYQQVSLSFDGVKRSAWLHRIVARAFVPNPDNLPEVNHVDCNPSNNDPKNLEWTSHQDNINHSLLLGRLTPPPMHRGESQWNARFTEDDVRQIRAEKANGASYDQIAAARECTKFAIYAIVKRKSWAHVA